MESHVRPFCETPPGKKLCRFEVQIDESVQDVYADKSKDEIEPTKNTEKYYLSVV